MFTITGKIKASIYTLTYIDGVLSGNDYAIEIAESEARKDHGSLGLQPDALDSGYLSQEIPAYALITSHVFESIDSEENDWERAPDDAVF